MRVCLAYLGDASPSPKFLVTNMSEPEVTWYIEQIQRMLGEIDKLVLTSDHLTNSIKEIISHNTNEIEIDLFTIVRKLREGK